MDPISISLRDSETGDTRSFAFARLRELMGLPEEQAVARAQADGFRTRISCRDGAHTVMDRALKLDRITLAIEAGRVVEAYVG